MIPTRDDARDSSNVDATAGLWRVGFARLAEFLQSDRYRLWGSVCGGGYQA
jgi:hypothetical protein